jgi:glycosyltransferase involved in cell wall biosynthesis
VSRPFSRAVTAATLKATAAIRTGRSRLEARFAAWSPDGPGPRRRAPAGHRHIGYYLWVYPLLSETFIRREIVALRETGLDVTVVADMPGDGPELDPSLQPLVREARYLLPVSPAALILRALAFLARRPLTFVRLLFYVLVVPWDSNRTLARDVRVFGKAIAIAAIMEDCGVTHVHSPWANVNAFMLLIVSRLLGTGFSLQARAHDIHRDDSAFALPQKFRHADFIVTNTRYNEASLRAMLPPAPRSRVHCIHNGIDLDDFVPDATPVRQADQFHILSVARLIEPKGITVLLRACRLLLDRGLRFECTIIGGTEEPLYTAYRVQVAVLHRQLGLTDAVRFCGAAPFDQVLDAMRTADLFVLPCVVAANGSKDITPNSLIEAMAMKLPVVSSRITAIPEIVTHGESGMLVPPGDVDALAATMQQVLEDPRLRQRLGDCARAAVERKFDVRANIDGYVRLFGEAT